MNESSFVRSFVRSVMRRWQRRQRGRLLYARRAAVISI